MKGRALQELSEQDRVTFDAAVLALCEQLDLGGKAMAAQDFRHCSQSENKSISDFIRRLERTFHLAYGHDKMLAETMYQTSQKLNQPKRGSHCLSVGIVEELAMPQKTVAN